MQNREEGWSASSATVFGLLLIAAGIAFLVVQWTGWTLPFDLERVGWPLYVIVPGAVLLLVGVFLSTDTGAGLAIAGSIVTVIGLILAYQSATGHFASWAYAWALVAPGGVGVGMILWGLVHLRGGMVRDGLGTLAVGLVLFLVGFGFFEGALNIGSGHGLAPLGRQALPLALIVAGAALILGRLWPRRRREWSGAWASPSPAEPGPAPTAEPSQPTE